MDLTNLDRKDLEQYEKPFGPLKATLSCLASVLKPGYGMAASIRQNRWLDGEAPAVPAVASLATFLRELLEL